MPRLAGHGVRPRIRPIACADSYALSREETLAASRKPSLSSTSRDRRNIRSGCQRKGASALRLAAMPPQLAGFEEPENRQHPPVLGCALRQVELGQDAADVFLDR